MIWRVLSERRTEDTGPQPGQRLHEALVGYGEIDDPPFHPLFSHVVVPALDPAVARNIDAASSPDHLVPSLRGLGRRALRSSVEARRGH